MENQLSVYTNFDNIQKAANALQRSGYFADVTSEAQAIVKVMAGAELGLPPFAAMSGIHIIKGKPVIGANVMATLVKNDNRYDYRIVRCDNTECIIAWFEQGKKVGESSFTIAEAQKIGLMIKDSWKNYPSDMLFARAISRGSRRFAPGIFGGSPVYTPDELNAETDEDGYVTGEVITTPEQPAPEQPAIEPAHEPTSAPDMPLEVALAVKNSDGTPYGEIDSKFLSRMTAGIKDGLQKSDLTPEMREEYLFKLNAIKVILKSRKAA